MRKIVIHRPGSYDRLRIEECAELTPGSQEVLIDVKAIGVNYADCLTRMGLYASAKHYMGYPITPGFEVAGRVVFTSPDVTSVQIGMPVMAVTRFNGYATQVVVNHKQIFQLPESLSLQEAAGFPSVFLTAWFALLRLAHPRRGASLLVHSAAGGVGGALVQLGKHCGCKVIGVVGASQKIEAVRELGADEVIDKSRQDLWAESESLMPQGFDVVLDANGMATLRGSYKHLAPMGKLVVYGFHSMLPKRRGRPLWFKLAWGYLRTPRFNPLKLTGDNKSILAFNLSYLFDKTDLLQTAMWQLLQWCRDGQIKPLKTTTYPFESVAEAHRALESGETIGKLVLELK